ncbi:MAG: hypothetical protein K0Q68_1013 [Moraxellaceae bacterium]|jgi:hypothetical protein|nr:hypothetical protein [Moraxellaceae bacterium]
MARVSNPASLNLIRPEVDANLAQVEAQISSYVEDRENPAILGACLEGMSQVHGALRMAEMAGAIQLAGGLADLVRQVQARGDQAADEDFAALGQGLMVLGRYLEYVQIHQVAWPQLLLPAINQVRAALHQPLLSEGSLLVLGELPVAPPVTRLEVTPAQLDALVRRVRLMYQTSLIAVIRDQADVPHFRMMSRACERARQVCGDRPQALFWWGASAALEALQQGVAVSPQRKILLGQIDRQLKALARNDGSGQPDRQLLADCLYVAALAAGGERVDQVKAAFDLTGQCLTQAQMTAEYETMCGPGGSVITAVAGVVKDELAQIKDTLDVMSRGSQNDAESYVAMADNLGRTSQTLVMLGLLESSQSVRRHADAMRGWSGAPDMQALGDLVDCLMEVENAMAGLVRRVTPGAENSSGNPQVSIHQLDEARALLVAESRSGLSLVKRAISSYLESSRDLLHLANVPATLQSVAGGLSFLGIVRGAAVLQACARYIDARMLGSEEQPGLADMETLADAISSIDYFLESLEANKPIGDGILEIAEESIAELGFPVSAAQAA